jgi:hypothetical protein
VVLLIPVFKILLKVNFFSSLFFNPPEFTILDGEDHDSLVVVSQARIGAKIVIVVQKSDT